MDPPNSAFIFAVGQPASAAELKAELGRAHPELSLAYSRPGLYTFKHRAGAVPTGFHLQSVFARHSGFSLGRAGCVDDVGALVVPTAAPGCLHVFCRDEGPERTTREMPHGPDQNTAHHQRANAVRQALLSKYPERFRSAERPDHEEWVLNVILPPESAPSEAWFLGAHQHLPGRSPLPGSVERKISPVHAPSRAWCKIEEAIDWAGLGLRGGQTAVEIGCAPGGALVALLERGLHVVGIDPAAVDPGVSQLAKRLGLHFVHLQLPVGAVKRNQLPSKVDWLLCDANLAPPVALRYLTRLVVPLRPSLRGIVFTIKLNDALMIQAIPDLIQQLRTLASDGGKGAGLVRAAQLPSHRRELVAVVTFDRS